MKKYLSCALYFLAVSGYCQEIPLISYLEALDSTTQYDFFYRNELLEELSIKVEKGSSDYLSDIEQVVTAAGLRIYVHQDRKVLLYPNRLEFERRALVRESTYQSDPIENSVIGNPKNLQDNFRSTLSGFVQNESGEPVSGVNVAVDGKLMSKTDDSGYYELKLHPKNYKLTYSFVGFEPENKLVTFYSEG
ncbi:MAG: carboxypeptidase regulatory-like domain-containing protein, partial [Ekhidna sp.]|nr:carboxypeptidase regulatory-like domain-containing protein [Ekhidna sp.]